jgi:hypothetical protein
VGNGRRWLRDRHRCGAAEVTEFELIRAFAGLPRSRREEIARSLGLKAGDVGTEEGIKRQFVAAKAGGKLGDLQGMLPKELK